MPLRISLSFISNVTGLEPLALSLLPAVFLTHDAAAISTEEPNRCKCKLDKVYRFMLFVIENLRGASSYCIFKELARRLIDTCWTRELIFVQRINITILLNVATVFGTFPSSGESDAINYLFSIAV